MPFGYLTMFSLIKCVAPPILTNCFSKMLQINTRDKDILYGDMVRTKLLFDLILKNVTKKINI